MKKINARTGHNVDCRDPKKLEECLKELGIPECHNGWMLGRLDDVKSCGLHPAELYSTGYVPGSIAKLFEQELEKSCAKVDNPSLAFGRVSVPTAPGADFKLLAYSLFSEIKPS